MFVICVKGLSGIFMIKRAKNDRIRKSASAVQIISIGFALIILEGALLLNLPIASKDGQPIGFINALFTATTSTCVTGLIVADTYSQWTLFGQAIILLLIQTGGLGFMTVSTLFAIMLRRRIGLRERMILSETISMDSFAGVVRLTKKILLCVLFFELSGAVLLATRFVPEFGIANGLYKSIFHSVSAFCNAGIDLMGQIEPYSSLVHFVHDPVVNFTIMALITIGGLGFIVWDDLFKFKKTGKLRLHTKLVLIISTALIFGGALILLVFEYTNPDTIGGFGLMQKIQASLFQSVTARTAGFNTIDFSAMREQSILVMIMLMLIGGSPGSTAGGIKTTTVGILVIAAFSVVKGASKVNIFGRRIGTEQIMRAIAIVMLSVFVVFAGMTVIMAADGVSMTEAAFEVSSAFATVGATMGITSTLSNVSKLTLIILMYLGRVGIITAAMAITKRRHMYEERIEYPVESILF